MKLLLIAWAILAVAACKPAPKAASIAPPVPVPTRPFEEGFARGMDAGRTEGRPRTTPLPEGALARMAEQAAGGTGGQSAQWQRGWVQGYHEGFRLRATGAR